jgi:hypothetical protein
MKVKSNGSRLALPSTKWPRLTKQTVLAYSRVEDMYEDNVGSTIELRKEKPLYG